MRTRAALGPVLPAQPPNNGGWWNKFHRLLTVAFVGCLVAVITLSVLPGTAVAALPATSDKLGHTLVYALLALLLRLVASRRPASRAVLLCSVIGAILELVQLRVPGRTADLGDVLWNAAGAALGAATAEWIMSSHAGRRPIRLTAAGRIAPDPPHGDPARQPFFRESAGS